MYHCRPVSAYALFFRDTQAAIKGQNPNASFGEVSKIVASMWDALETEHKNVSTLAQCHYPSITVEPRLLPMQTVSRTQRRTLNMNPTRRKENSVCKHASEKGMLMSG